MRSWCTCIHHTPYGHGDESGDNDAAALFARPRENALGRGLGSGAVSPPRVSYPGQDAMRSRSSYLRWSYRVPGALCMFSIKVSEPGFVGSAEVASVHIYEVDLMPLARTDGRTDGPGCNYNGLLLLSIPGHASVGR